MVAAMSVLSSPRSVVVVGGRVGLLDGRGGGRRVGARGGGASRGRPRRRRRWAPGRAGCRRSEAGRGAGLRLGGLERARRTGCRRRPGRPGSWPGRPAGRGGRAGRRRGAGPRRRSAPAGRARRRRRSARPARWPCGSPRPRPGAPRCARRPRARRPPRPRGGRSPRPRGAPASSAARAAAASASRRTRSSSTCCQAARPERITSPSALVMTRHDLIASSLPGMTYWMPSGSTVRVDQADDRDAQALGLLDGDRLRLEVDDEHRVRRALHVLDAAEVGLQLVEVGLRLHALLRRQQLELPLRLEALEVVQALDALRDGLEVREHAAQPAVVDVRHAAGLRDLLDGVARLLLGPDEQDRAAAVGDALGEAAARSRARPPS